MKNRILKLEPFYSEKVWGYEEWTLSTHRNGHSKIKNSDTTLINHIKEELPILNKIIKANDTLSVQVHPDDEFSRKYENDNGKTECWYIISAEPGAEIIYGHNAKSREELAEMIKSGDWDHLLRKVKVKTGDFFHVPSGTMHAIGAGIVILETQQSSDTTYRVYDFDRKDDQGNLRELHIQQSIDVLNIPGDKVPENQVKTEKFADAEITTLVKSDFFDVYKWQIHGDHEFTKVADYTLVSVLDGQGKLTIDGNEYPVEKGAHFILPSNIEKWNLSGQLEIIASNPA